MFQTIHFLYGLVEILKILLREIARASLFPFWLIQMIITSTNIVRREKRGRNMGPVILLAFAVASRGVAPTRLRRQSLKTKRLVP
jgi:hypothetical protein